MHRMIRGWLLAAVLCVLAGTAAAETQKLTVGVHRQMDATLFAPDGPGPYPAVLVLHTSGGLKQADLDYARQLADEGYVCLVPAFLDAYGLAAFSRVETFTVHASDIYDDFVAAIAQLRTNPKVAGGKVAAVGFSNGGYFAMWLAGTGKVDAGVSYYGALTGAGSDKTLSRFASAFTANSSPVLILHGTSDRTVPVAAAERLQSIIERAGSPVTMQLYKGVGHQFERELRNDETRAAAADAWTHTLAFLSARLRGS
ncbi:MAG: dienelactone hydrolase family protein [Gemmatimonas sp.]